MTQEWRVKRDYRAVNPGTTLCHRLKYVFFEKKEPVVTHFSMSRFIACVTGLWLLPEMITLCLWPLPYTSSPMWPFDEVGLRIYKSESSSMEWVSIPLSLFAFLILSWSSLWNSRIFTQVPQVYLLWEARASCHAFLNVQIHCMCNRLVTVARNDYPIFVTVALCFQPVVKRAIHV